MQSPLEQHDDSAIGYAIGETLIGHVLVARGAQGIVAILLGDTPTALVSELAARYGTASVRQGGDAATAAALAAVTALVEVPTTSCDLALDIRGTAFQRRVWKALREIPCGTTRSYTDIARSIGAPHAVRAVAGACAANPLAVAIPCHRVRRSDGGLAGYRWGIERKRALLAREAATA